MQKINEADDTNQVDDTIEVSEMLQKTTQEKTEKENNIVTENLLQFMLCNFIILGMISNLWIICKLIY